MCDRADVARTDLNFVDAARSAFGFLKALDFSEVASDETIVRYATDRVSLSVYHGRSSYELGIELRMLADTAGAPGHSMSALIRLERPEEAARFRNAIATTPLEVESGVGELAKLVQAYGGQALRGEPTVFARLQQQRSEWAAQYADEVAYAQVLPAADDAFRSHDYARAARLYEQIPSEADRS